MNRHSNPSPRTRTAPQNKPYSSTEEKDLLILNLQSNLQALEEKYTLFISKCSELLKSDNLKSETRDYFSECSSSVRFSPDFLLRQEDLQENESLLQYLNEIEQGDLLKQHMSAISDLINKSQEAMLVQLKDEKSHEKCIQRTLTMLKSQLWDLLFRKEEILKVTIKSCLNKFKLFDKILEDSLSAVKHKRKMKEFKKRYLGASEENERLLAKIKEQHECLNKIQADYARLKQRVLAGSAIDNERHNKAGRLTLEFNQNLFSNSLVSSPNLNSSRKLQESNKNLHNRGKNLSLQNSILNHGKSVKNNESSSIESEKKEIQEQLRNLNNKLAGFEKIAKNLIDSGIRAELNQIGQNPPVHMRNSKNDESSQLSPLISILELDKIQKDFEKSVVENSYLSEILENERKKSEDLWKKCVEKDKVMKELWQEFEKLKKKSGEQVEEYEAKVLKSEEQNAGLEDQVKELSEKLGIVENEKMELLEELNGCMESKKVLEARIKKWEEDYSKLQESTQASKTLEDNTLLLTNKLSLLENSLQISKTNNEKLQINYESLKSSYDALEKSQQSLLESLQNANNNTNDLCNLTQSLESSQSEYKKLMSKYDSYKKTSEKIISDKDKIISSFELKNLENFKLNGELSRLQVSLDELQQEVVRLRIKNEGLDKEVLELKALNETYEKTIREYEVDNIQTASKVKGLMEGVKELNVRLKENCEKLKVAEDEKAVLALENEKMAGKIKAFSDRCRSDEGTLEFLGNTVEEKDRTIEEMKEREKEMIEKMDKEIDKKNVEIDRKNKEIFEKNEEIMEKDREIYRKNGEIKEKNEEIDKKNEEIDKKNKEIITKNQEIKEKSEEIASKIQDLHKKNKEIDEKTKELLNKNQEIQEKSKSLSTQSAEIQSLEGQISIAKSASSTLESEKNQLMIQLQALKEHQLANEKIISEKSALILTYEQSLNDLENLNAALKSSSLSESWPSKLAEKDLELENLKQANSSLQQSLKTYEEKLKKLGQDLNSSQESWNLCKIQLKESEDKCLLSIENEKKMVQEFEDIKKSLETELSLVKSELDQARQGLNTKQGQIDSLKSDLASKSADSEKTIFDLQEKLRTLSADLDTLHNNKAELQEKQTKAQKNWEKDLKKLESNEQSLSLIVQNLTNSNENLKKSLQESQNTIKKLKTQLTRLQSGLKNLNIPSLKQSLQDFSHFFQVKSSDFKGFISNPQNLSMFSTLFQIYSSSNKVEKTNLQSANSIIQQKLECAEYEKEQLSKNLIENRKTLEKTVVESTEFKGKLMSLETDYSKNAEMVKILKESIKKLEADYLKLQQKSEKSEENGDKVKILMGKLEGFKNTNSELVSELEKYKKQVSEFSSANEKLSQQIKRIIQDNQDLKGDLEVYNTRIIEKNKQIEKLTEKMENFKETNIDSKDYEKQILLKKQELHAMNHENLILSKKLDEKNKYIEETSKSLNLLKVENDRLFKEAKSLKASNETIVENVLEKDLIIRRLEDTIVSMENLIKSSEKTEEELRAALSFVQEQLDNKLSGAKPDQNMFLSPKNNMNPNSRDNSRVDSQASKSGVIEKQSGYTDELNITPCKILRVIKAAGKKWVLCAGEKGEYVWKDENNLHVSGADTLLEPEEDMDEIKAALGDHYRGSILEAIESLKTKAIDLNLSAQFTPTEKLENFKNEFFGAGLDLSNIDMKLQDDNFDQLNNDLVNKNLELIEKDKKIDKKKKEILLLREENKVLKDQYREFEDKKRDLENKVQSSLAVNLPYLKLVFSNLIGKVKVDKSLEDFIVVIYKILDFSQDEINQLQSQRKGKKVLKSK